MSSYLSTLLSNTTSRYTTLRRTLLSSSSEDQDTTIDSPEDSHISRVLRAYYTEKGRPFPPWLPPDPRSTQPPVVNPAISSSGYGNPSSYPAPSGQRASTTTPNPRGGLSDLWADSPSPPPPAEKSLSLRKQGLGGRAPQRLGAAIPQRPPAVSEGPANVRPLPSQRVGSYQGLRQGG